jgi:hypothetical protein
MNSHHECYVNEHREGLIAMTTVRDNIGNIAYKRLQ